MVFKWMNPRSMCIFYFLLGVVLNYPRIAARLFLIDTLQIDVVVFASIEGLLVLPWIMKPFYGFISDRFPICGTRRKAYIMITNILAAVCWTCFYLPMKEKETLARTVSLLVVISLLTCFSDVMYDSIIVEYAQRENKKGTLQTYCWMARSVGSITGTLIGGVMITYLEPVLVLSSTAILHLLTLIFANYWIHERYAQRGGNGEMNLKNIFQKIKRGVSEPSLWKPVLFVVVFVCSPSSNDAFTYYLIEELHFSPEILTVLACLGHLGMLIGSYIYQKSFRNWSLRRFFLVMILVSSVSSLSPLVLVSKLNKKMHIPDAVFAAGDDFFLATLGEITFMPCLILAAQLCPPGIEATLYALIVSLVNLSSMVSDYGGAGLAAILSVSRNNFDNLGLLIFICCLSKLTPLLLICLIEPKTIQQISIDNHHSHCELYETVSQNEIMMYEEKGGLLQENDPECHPKETEMVENNTFDKQIDC